MAYRGDPTKHSQAEMIGWSKKQTHAWAIVRSDNNQIDIDTIMETRRECREAFGSYLDGSVSIRKIELKVMPQGKEKGTEK